MAKFGKIDRGQPRSGAELVWRDQGWQELALELMPGTIGTELQEPEPTT